VKVRAVDGHLSHRNGVVVKEPIRLGDLQGNRFEIVLRDVRVAPEVVNAAAEAVRQSGFVNYFGLQRFGRGGTGSHLIGREALRGQWRGTVELMFTSRAGEREDILRGKEAFQEGRYADAKQLLPRSMYSEHLVLEGLLRDPNNFNAAYMRVPHSTRLLCLHAFQSYIWNFGATHRFNKITLVSSYSIVVLLYLFIMGISIICPHSISMYVVYALCALLCSSNRVQTHGLVVVEGDLVIEGGADACSEPLGEDEEAVAAASLDDAEAEAEVGMSANRDQQVRLVTTEDVSAGRYAITDVVLPLPSHDSAWPSHSTGAYMQSLLEENGITQDMFNAQKGRLGGAYRRVVVHPQDMIWRCQHYARTNDDIQQTELASFRGDAAPAPLPAAEEGEGDGEDRSKRFLAAVVEFSLPSGTYATMLLRELMKSATDSTHHASMTAANAEEADSVERNDSAVSKKNPLEENDCEEGGSSSSSSEKRQRCA
jgi:tRNA pseudouridine13 synthase